jgi:hypothetical protein
MEYIIGTVFAVIAFYFYVFIIQPHLRENRDWKHNWQQYTIYEQAVSKILDAMLTHEESAENTILVLNAIVDTYNESLRGEQAESMMAPYFKEPKYDTGRQHPDSEGQEPERQEPSRAARKRVDSNDQARASQDSGSIEK